MLKAEQLSDPVCIKDYKEKRNIRVPEYSVKLYKWKTGKVFLILCIFFEF